MLPHGALLSESTVHTDLFAVLAAFVAINTVMYVALAVAKMLPKFYLSDWVNSGQRRARTRSIHPHRSGD
ncbi:hypothetical protein C6I20_16835 [Aeromicrobium sp. A1-2]|nr:hypothetical protein C6I20_16835 [Aeromicrobium sp. A1-2]